MKKLHILPVTTLFILSTSASVFAAALKSDEDKFSYTIGFQIGQSIKRDGIKPNTKVLMQAIDDVMADKEPALSTTEMREAVTKFQQQQMAKRDEKAKVAKAEGEKFLTENKKKKGIKTTESGLQYKVIKEGKGKKPAASDTIVAHYEGKLLDGTIFDSSYKRNQPATFGVGAVIKGWQEILPMMTVGSKWQVYIPSELAYGERGAGGNIGPNETLVFDIELLEIKDSDKDKDKKK